MPKNKDKNLIRAFGLRMAIILVMSAIIGSGVFKKVTPMAEVLGSPGLVILAWFLAGLVILAGVVSIAELAALFPHSGGPYSWLNEIYGKLPAFLYGWSSFTVIQSAGIASVAFVFSGALNTFLPLPHLSPELEKLSFLGVYFLDNIGAKIITCIMIIGLTIANIRGAKKGGGISQIFTFSIILCIAFIIVSSFSSEEGNWQTLAIKGSAYPVGGYTFLALISAMIVAIRHAFWGFQGWIALGFIGEEIKQPKKNMPKAMVYGIIGIMLIYILVNWAYLYVMPIDEILQTVHLDENNIAAVTVIDKIFDHGGAYVVSAMILISTFGCTNASILVSARIYYAMAQKGWFFKSAAKPHQKYKTPHKSLIYQGVWACLLTFSGSFEILTGLVVIAAFVFYGLIVFGVVVLRRKQPDLKRPYKAFGYPFVPWFFSLFCVMLLLISFIESPGKSMVGLVLIFSGLPFYYYWKSKKKKTDAQVIQDKLEKRNIDKKRIE